MALELIKINEFPETSALLNWLVTAGEDGEGKKISLDNVKAELGVDALMQFGGAIVPTSTPEPTGDFFWIAIEEGTYTNFGGVVVPAASMAVISRIDGVFTSSITTIPQPENRIDDWEAGTYNQGDQRIWNDQIWSVNVASTTEAPGTGTDWVPKTDAAPSTINEIYTEISNFKEDVGVDEIPAESEFATALISSDIDDINTWSDGYITPTGSIAPTDLIKHTIDYYPIVGGYTYSFRLAVYGEAALAFYDHNKQFISAINRGGGSNYTFWETIALAPASAAYYRTSHVTPISTELPTSGISITNTTAINSPTSNVFLKTIDFPNKVSEEMSHFGFDRIPAGINVLEEIAASTLEEGEIWGRGFLNSSFNVDPLMRKWHGKKYYKIEGGQVYEHRLYANLASKIVFYDKNKYPISYASGDGNPGTWVGEMTSPEGAEYLRISHDYEPEDNLVRNIYFRNKNDIYLRPSNDFDLVEIYKREHPPKKRTAIVSLVADDCYIQNEWFIDILDAKNVKATFAAVKDWTDTAGFFTKERLVELHNNGHELANHTTTHRRTGDLPEEEQYEEIYRNYVFLLGLTGYVPTFVAPFGSQTEVTERIARQFHKVALRTQYTKDSISPISDSINLPPIDKYRATRVSFDATENGIFLIDLAKSAIDEAVANGGWVIFTVHPQFNEYQNAANRDARRQEVAELIDYAKSLDVEIMPVRDALTIYDNPKTVGNFRLDARYWELGMDGSTKGAL